MTEPTRESAMVSISPGVWCDPEIVDLVTALNAGGVATVASCSGHGERFGNIALKDGRELIIAPDFEAARRLEKVARNAMEARTGSVHDSAEGDSPEPAIEKEQSK